jgi:hypothetical protein
MTRLRLLAVAAPILLIGAATPRSTTDFAPGLTYTFTSHVQTTDPNGQTTDRVVMSGHAAILGDRARIDLDSMGAQNGQAQQQSSGSSMRGVYFLSLNGGSRLVYVDPTRKQYMDMNVGGMMRGLSALTSSTGGLIKIQASNVHIDADKIGAGPTILGYSTVHYRLTESKTMNTRVLFKTVTSRDSSVTDLYYAPDLKNFINPFLSSSQAMTGALDMYGPEYKQQYMAAHAKLYQEGAPLRAVSTVTSTDGSGKMRTTVSTTEVTQLSAGNVNATLFDIPPDYSKVDVSVPQSATASAQADSAHPADSAASKSSLVKKGLKGLFGRPQ